MYKTRWWQTLMGVLLVRCRKEFMRQMNTSAYNESDDEEDGRPRGVQCAQQ